MGSGNHAGGYSCPVEATVDLIGGKWKCVLLFHLLGCTRRFNELRRMLPDVTPRMLTLQLRELEQAGIVQRTVYAQVPPKVEYSLTEFGESLKPVLIVMRDWGASYVAMLERQQAASGSLAQAAS